MADRETIKLEILRNLLEYGARITPNYPDQGLVEIAEIIYQWVIKSDG